MTAQVAFGRFRVAAVDARAGPTRLDVCRVDAVVDAEPEDDVELRERHDLLARRPALAAAEMRAHLRFMEVAQLLEWQDAAPTAAAALDEDRAADDFLAVRRFAPRGPAADDEACSIDGDSDACLLERAYVRRADISPTNRGGL